MTRGSAFRAANGARSSGTHSRSTTRSPCSRGTARSSSSQLGSVPDRAPPTTETLLDRVSALSLDVVQGPLPVGCTAGDVRGCGMPYLTVAFSQKSVVRGLARFSEPVDQFGLTCTPFDRDGENIVRKRGLPVGLPEEGNPLAAPLVGEIASRH